MIEYPVAVLALTAWVALVMVVYMVMVQGLVEVLTEVHLVVDAGLVELLGQKAPKTAGQAWL
jgi:hypothetical protein